MDRLLVRITACSLLLWSCVCFAAGPQLAFEDAWVRAMPPGMHMTAAYGMLRNTGNETLTIQSFDSTRFGEVSLHRSELENGVSRMREVPELEIEAGGSVKLEPGGYHLMLMTPRAPMTPGLKVPLRAVLADGQEFEFTVPVERR